MAKKVISASENASTKTAVTANAVALPLEGYVRVKQILAPYGPIPMSRAKWLAGVKSGIYPQPTKFFGPGITAWNVADIRAFLAQAELSA